MLDCDRADIAFRVDVQHRVFVEIVSATGASRNSMNNVSVREKYRILMARNLDYAEVSIFHLGDLSPLPPGEAAARSAAGEGYRGTLSNSARVLSSFALTRSSSDTIASRCRLKAACAGQRA